MRYSQYTYYQETRFERVALLIASYVDGKKIACKLCCNVLRAVFCYQTSFHSLYSGVYTDSLQRGNVAPNVLYSAVACIFWCNSDDDHNRV